MVRVVCVLAWSLVPLTGGCESVKPSGVPGPPVPPATAAVENAVSLFLQHKEGWKLDEWQRLKSRQNQTQAQSNGRSVPAPEGVEL